MVVCFSFSSKVNTHLFINRSRPNHLEEARKLQEQPDINALEKEVGDLKLTLQKIDTKRIEIQKLHDLKEEELRRMKQQ